MTPELTRQQYNMIKGITKTRVITGDALVTAVYQGPKKTDESDDTDEYLEDINGLYPGQVKVNLAGKDDRAFDDKSAWVLTPYGHHPDTGDKQNLEPFSLNQSFGSFSMPRIGDKVFVIGNTSGDMGTLATKFYVFGSLFSIDAHRPPLTDAEDVQILHRSGASIRLNDTCAGGGSIGSDGTETDGYMKGLTGNVTITGNRTMILSGSKYLPHGLLAKYGDPREDFDDAQIDASSTVGTYDTLFSNEEEPDSYHDPFIADLLEQNYFLSPPSTDDSVIPLTDNSLVLVQHGGGVMRIDDHDTESGYSRITMSAASMTTLIGKDYQPVGLAGVSTSPNGYDDASGINEDTDEFAIYQIQGARFKIYAAGDVEVWAAPGKNITIKSSDGEGKVLLGEGTKAVFRDGDETTTDKGSSSHMCPIFQKITHTHYGHSHEGVEQQDETYA